MNMQALMQQAQKMQKEMQKKQPELDNPTFEVSSAGGAIKIKIKGSRQIEQIEIDKDAIDPEEKEMLKEMRDAGVKITAQFTPSDSEADVSNLLD